MGGKYCGNTSHSDIAVGHHINQCQTACKDRANTRTQAQDIHTQWARRNRKPEVPHTHPPWTAAVTNFSSQQQLRQWSHVWLRLGACDSL